MGAAPQTSRSEESLIYRAAEAEGCYRALAEHLPGKRDVFLPMAAQAHSQQLSLRGILRLQNRDCPLPPLPSPQKGEPADALLRKSCHRCMVLAQEYARRGESGEFGCIYREIVRETEWQIARLTEILGSFRS